MAKRNLGWQELSENEGVVRLVRSRRELTQGMLRVPRVEMRTLGTLE